MSEQARPVGCHALVPSAAFGRTDAAVRVERAAGRGRLRKTGGRARHAGGQLTIACFAGPWRGRTKAWHTTEAVFNTKVPR
jgi:hypothetical protein